MLQDTRWSPCRIVFETMLIMLFKVVCELQELHAHKTREMGTINRNGEQLRV
jgi:hypothetical protein